MSGEQDNRAIGNRVREAMLNQYGSSRTQGQIAAEVRMTPDAYSRSLRGERAFSTAELARAAAAFDADLHFLITGESDPLRAVIAARHSYDRETFSYRNHGAERDRAVRDGVMLAYRQAAPWLSTSEVDLPRTAAECRDALGEDFTGNFADRVEATLGVDVVRLPGLSTDYSITVGDQKFVLLKTEPNWFHSNWSLAHELGHLCLGHHDEDGTHSNTRAETEANEFAAELLLPADLMHTLDWATATPTDAATFVWSAGVSTTAIRNRLVNLGLSVTEETDKSLDPPTQRLLRRNPVEATVSRPIEGRDHHLATIVDPITDRMSHAAERRIPVRLMKALRNGIEEGNLNTGTLGWLLDVDPQTLELDKPEPAPEVSTNDLINLLGL